MRRPTNLEWYKLCIWAYSKINVYGNIHKHHIKPKCLYPDLANDKNNLIEVPAIIHWALHKLLFEHYLEVGNDEAVNKLKYVDIETFINDGQKNYAKNHPTAMYDFSKADEILKLIKNIVYNYVVATKQYNSDMKQLEDFEKSLNKRFRDYTIEEKKTRTTFKSILKMSADKQTNAKKTLQKISDEVLHQFGIQIKDELESYTDTEVFELIN